MKQALNDKGEKITAAQDAPAEARCPRCGQVVLLRRRRLMNDRGVVYYWRHKNGGKLPCEERSKGYGRS
jgi:hypothetical protein